VLSNDKKTGFLIETLAKPLSNEFIEEIGFVVDIMIDITGYIKREKQYEKIFDLNETIGICNYDVMKNKLYLFGRGSGGLLFVFTAKSATKEPSKKLSR
jgi:predicted transcriptional regulator